MDMESLIPHRPPMQLIDGVISWDETRLWAHVSISELSPFLDGNGVPTCIGLEYLAQAAAAFFAINAQHTEAGSEPRAGMLIGSRRYTVTLPYFDIGSQLIIRTKLSSKLPCANTGPTLVKFNGDISLLQPIAPSQSPNRLGNNGDMLLITPAEAEALPRFDTMVRCDLSVYV